MDGYGRKLGAKQFQHKPFFPFCSEGFLPTSQVIGHYFWTINRYGFGKTLQPTLISDSYQKNRHSFGIPSVAVGKTKFKKIMEQMVGFNMVTFCKKKQGQDMTSHACLGWRWAQKCAVSGKNMIRLHKSFVICRCKQPCLLIHLKQVF